MLAMFSRIVIGLVDWSKVDIGGLIWDWQSGKWIDPGVASRRIEAKSSSVETLRPASILDLFPVPLRDCSVTLVPDWRDMCQSAANCCRSIFDNYMCAL